MALIKDTINIVNSNYAEELNSNSTMLLEEFNELKELIHITLEYAYDDKYDKLVVDNHLKIMFKHRIFINDTDPEEPNHLQFREIKQEPEAELEAGQSFTESKDRKFPQWIQDRLTQYESRSMGDQRTDDWLKKRNNYLTASTIAQAANLCAESARTNLLLEKGSCGSHRTFFGNVHTHHGNQFEPVVNSVYCYRNDTIIYDYGLIAHKTIPFLGASTDGVACYPDQLRNIEIKSPTGRKINGKVKKEYYHQTQLQMEVLELPVTDFIEAKFKQYTTQEEFLRQFYFEDDRREQMEKGCMIEVINLESKELEYIYSPIEYYLNHEILLDWVKQQDILIEKSDNIVFIREIYWELTEYSCIEVKRDPKWLPTHYPELERFWNEVLELRKDPDKLSEMLIDIEERKNQRKNSPIKSKIDTILMI